MNDQLQRRVDELLLVTVSAQRQVDNVRRAIDALRALPGESVDARELRIIVSAAALVANELEAIRITAEDMGAR